MQTCRIVGSELHECCNPVPRRRKFLSDLMRADEVTISRVGRTVWSLAARRSLVAFVVCSGLLLFVSKAAHATTFTVNSTIDAVDANLADGVCDDGTGKCTLRAAIMQANANPGADFITLPSGTYVLTIPGPGEGASATGDLDITDDLTLSGACAKTTIIQGDGADRVLEIENLTTSLVVTVSDVTITGGYHDFGGGVVMLNEPGTLTLNRCAIDGNSGPSGNLGGGLGSVGRVILNHCTVSRNSARFGGGIMNYIGTITLNNCTVSGNTAPYGGAIAHANHGPLTVINNCTIASNVAIGGNGAGLYAVEGRFILKNTILANGGHPTTANCYLIPPYPSLVSKGYNISSDISCVGVNGGGFNLSSDKNDTDPLLAPLADNGGPTETQALLPNSPAIDAGTADCPATDQRGVLRPQGLSCDIGAYEFGSTPLTNCCVPPPADMVAWWPLDEASGNSVADIVGSHDGTTQPASIGGFADPGPVTSTLWGPPAIPVGLVNNSLYFYGGRHIEVPSHADLDPGTGDFTIDAWVYYEGAGTGQDLPIAQKWDQSTGEGWRFLIRDGSPTEGGLWFLCQGSGSVLQTITANTWHHVATVLSTDGNGVKLVKNYVDGVSSSQIGRPANIASNANLFIGGDGVLAEDIAVDEVEIFNRALDGNEILEIFNAGSVGKCKLECFATGDVDGDGSALTVADLIFLNEFVNFAGDAPTPLYQGDLTGDGFIDQADVDIFNCYLTYGFNCFPEFPVPTVCSPNANRGACFSSAECTVRSPANCSATGGTYEGDGVFCCHTVSIDTIRTLNGLTVTVPISRADASLFSGGFDLLISYDASVLSFIAAEAGALLDSLDWEYFTYRTGAGGNCTGGCPSGLVRLVAIADLDNGPMQHPAVSAASGVLADLRFQVSGNRNLIGQCAPVQFFWNDCGDNAFSSVDGNVAYVEQSVSNGDGTLIWDELDDVQYPDDSRPAGVGTPDACLTGGGPGKPLPKRRICFRNGWVCIDEPPDDRGDINLNGIANEVADAVLFSRFFIYGNAVWDTLYQESQILASDVNDDGIVLTIADLIYLIRIITGDAQAFPPGGNPKPTSNDLKATVDWHVMNHQLVVDWTSESEAGAVLLVFDHEGLQLGAPSLGPLASGVELISRDDGSQLRLLIYGLGKGERLGGGNGTILSVPVRGGDGSVLLSESEAADYWGNPMRIEVAKSESVPRQFTLLQNVPNPFNAGTRITFTIPDAGMVRLDVFDALGRRVASLVDEQLEPGTHTVVWDARDSAGRNLASGVYFYRLTTAKQVANRKMVLLK